MVRPLRRWTWRQSLMALAGGLLAFTAVLEANAQEGQIPLNPEVLGEVEFRHLWGSPASFARESGGGFGSALTALSEYLVELDEASYDLKFNLTNYALRAEPLPWLEALESWVWAVKRAFEVIAASSAGDDIATPP